MRKAFYLASAILLAVVQAPGDARAQISVSVSNDPAPTQAIIRKEVRKLLGAIKDLAEYNSDISGPVALIGVNIERAGGFKQAGITPQKYKELYCTVFGGAGQMLVKQAEAVVHSPVNAGTFAVIDDIAQKFNKLPRVSKACGSEKALRKAHDEAVANFCRFAFSIAAYQAVNGQDNAEVMKAMLKASSTIYGVEHIAGIPTTYIQRIRIKGARNALGIDLDRWDRERKTLTAEGLNELEGKIADDIQIIGSMEKAGLAMSDLLSKHEFTLFLTPAGSPIQDKDGELVRLDGGLSPRL